MSDGATADCAAMVGERTATERTASTQAHTRIGLIRIRLPMTLSFTTSPLAEQDVPSRRRVRDARCGVNQRKNARRCFAPLRAVCVRCRSLGCGGRHIRYLAVGRAFVNFHARRCESVTRSVAGAGVARTAWGATFVAAAPATAARTAAAHAHLCLHLRIFGALIRSEQLVDRCVRFGARERVLRGEV